MTAAAGRVAGWDLLRGLCALAVACYHLSYWLDFAELPALGTYGVYLFFVLSGASLAYTYREGELRGLRPVASFLVVRWLRLAPLYLVLCLVFAVMLEARSGAPVDRLAWRVVLNGTFAFGLHDPATWALLIGGWSLGIEFVFYLLFPWLLRAAASPRLRWAVLVLLAGVQASWIAATIVTDGWAQANVAYHQVPAFGAWFFAGCVIGCLQRERAADLPWWAAGWAWLALAALLTVFMPARAGDELLGWAGWLLPAACVAVVWLSGRASFVGAGSRIASVAGDVTYGTYLLHPMLLFGVLWFVRPLETMGTGARVAVFAAVLATSCFLAWASERWFERPIRRWGKARLRRLQSEPASISS